MESKESRTFEINPKIEMKKVRFTNRYGITLAGDLYLPENYEAKKNPAVIVAGPFGAVKEQASGLYRAVDKPLAKKICIYENICINESLR